MRFSICVPTLNAMSTWSEFSAGLKCQQLSPKEVLVIDSASDDGTAAQAEYDGFRVIRIQRHEFHHGRTRQLAVDHCGDVDVLVFLTQDSILADSSAIDCLLRAFDDPLVGAAYGRQLPRNGASPIEAHARLFNYPATSAIRTIKTATAVGLKTAFFSNSFGAYRRSALASIGGFRGDVNFGEDTVATARLLLAGWKIAYVAEAKTFHSHKYTIRQEWKRYREIGKLHACHSWMIRSFGTASGEGFRFVLSELAMLAAHSPFLIPSAITRSLCKFIAYKLSRLQGCHTCFTNHSAGIPSIDTPAD